MRKHTRPTPAGVPRGRSKYTRRERRQGWCDHMRRPIGERRDLVTIIGMSADATDIVDTLTYAKNFIGSVKWECVDLTPPA